MTSPARADASTRLEIPIEGMTCASCAARIEKRLNKLDGVSASVNYATERATVTFDPSALPPERLVSAIEQIGYRANLPQPEAHTRVADGEVTPADSHAAALRRRLIVCLVLSAPVLVLSMVPALEFDNWQWLALQLATPVVLWGAWPFHRAAWRNARHGAATMDTLISVGTLAAYAWSLYALFVGEAGNPGMRMAMGFDFGAGAGTNEIYLEVASVVTTFVVAGRFFEARAKARGGAAIKALLELGAKDVTLLVDGEERLVAIGQLAVGDRFVARPGEKIATDGVVESGVSTIDTSLLTGESVPREIGPGESVAGATMNVSGRLVVRATRVGGDTALAQIARLVTEAQSGKAAAQRLADRISSVFVPIVIGISVATLGFWLGGGSSPAYAFTAAVAVLIIACPCALGLATPTALLVGTGRGAQLGLLIRGVEVLESTRRIDTIVLDKTGTVTTGKMRMIAFATDRAELDALRLVGAAEGASEHPIARAIADAARARVGALPEVEQFVNLPGLGVEAVVEGVKVVVGRPQLLLDRGMPVPEALEEAVRAAHANGHTVVVAAWADRVQAVFAVADTVKEGSAEATQRLRDLGLHLVLLTGDTEATAAAIAEEVKIDSVVAEVLPHEKVEAVRRLQAQGHAVAMVGDGVNDAPALAAADLGIALGTGTDAAIEASDLTIVSGDLRAAVDAIRLSRRTLGTIKANLFWAFAYNVAAIPLAAAGFLNPIIASATMAFSSFFVVTNSLRLRGFKPTHRGV